MLSIYAWWRDSFWRRSASKQQKSKKKSDKKLRTKCSLFAQGVIADEKWDTHSSDSMSSSENKWSTEVMETMPTSWIHCDMVADFQFMRWKTTWTFIKIVALLSYSDLNCVKCDLVSVYFIFIVFFSSMFLHEFEMSTLPALKSRKNVFIIDKRVFKLFMILKIDRSPFWSISKFERLICLTSEKSVLASRHC